MDEPVAVALPMADPAAASFAPRLAGAPNFRDLGGYPTADGRRVRCGRLFRSDALGALTAGDLEALDRLGIRLVCDLRGAAEQTACPSRWPRASHVKVLSLDVGHELSAGNRALSQLLNEAFSACTAREMMRMTYRNMPRAFVGRLAQIADQLIVEGNAPALIHCTAGKDRTGFLSAVLLVALGVPMQDVYRDYLLTGERADTQTLAASTAQALAAALEKSPDAEAAEVLCSVSSEWLDIAFNAVEDEFGSIENYLAVAGNLDPRRVAQLRNLLLESQPWEQ